MKYILIAFLLTGLLSCDGFGINKKNSYINVISSCCNTDNMWGQILEECSLKNLEDIEVKRIVSEFEALPFSTNILYFESNPEEYIGVSKNGSSIRYIYNDDLSPNVLNGLSTELSDLEKMRITLRVNAVMMNYLNESGKKEAFSLIKRQIASVEAEK